MRNRLLSIAVCGLMATTLAAQVATPTQPAPSTPAGVAQPGMAPPPINVNPLLAQLEQTAMSANTDISRLRIEKWKADGNSKQQATANAESVQRNLASALPGMIANVRSSPDNLAATFKLYRNMNALYDVLASLAESTGAFGPKDDYDALARDARSMDQIRRRMADQIESLANFKDAQVSQLMLRVREQAAAAAATPPKKVVVDDQEQKPTPKKKKTPAKSSTQTKKPSPPASTPPPQ